MMTCDCIIDPVVTGEESFPLPNYIRYGAVNLYRFGVRGDGSDETIEIQAAFTHADSLGIPVEIPSPPVRYLVTNTIDMTQMKIIGEKNATILGYRLNAPIFRVTTNGPQMNQFIQGLSFLSYFEPTDSFDNSVGLQIKGDSGWFQWNEFSNLKFTGMRYGIQSLKPHVISPFGKEGTLAWSNYDHVEFHDGSRPMEAGIHLPNGSGTGNKYTNLKGILGSVGSSFLKMGGPGYVVGDILVEGDFGGLSNQTAVLRINDGSVYLSRISFGASQFDADMDKALVIGAVSVTPSAISLVGNNHGGLARFAGGLSTGIENSDITDIDTSRWSIGKRIRSHVNGFHNIPCFRLELNDWESCKAEIVVQGLVGGVANGVLVRDYLFRRNGTGSTVIKQVASNFEPTNLPFVLNVTQSGNSVQVAITFTPTNPFSNMEVQLNTVGGALKIHRL